MSDQSTRAGVATPGVQQLRAHSAGRRAIPRSQPQHVNTHLVPLQLPQHRIRDTADAHLRGRCKEKITSTTINFGRKWAAIGSEDERRSLKTSCSTHLQRGAVLDEVLGDQLANGVLGR